VRGEERGKGRVEEGRGEEAFPHLFKPTLTTGWQNYV